MATQKGFTVLDLLIAIAVLGVISAGLAAIFIAGPLTQKNIAIQSAEIYVTEMRAAKGLTLLSCLSADNDKDGKVSCTFQNDETKQTEIGFCESTIWSKFMGGSCSGPRPFTVNEPQ